MMPDAQPDIIQELSDGSIIQHGSLSQRIYLIKGGSRPINERLQELSELAKLNGYTKIFAKASRQELTAYLDQKYVIEAFVPNYYRGKEDLFMLCYYIDPRRYNEDKILEYNRILQLARSKSKKNQVTISPTEKDTTGVRLCTEADIPQMVKIYRRVFPTYPFPIDDPEYLRVTMENHIDYYCYEQDGVISALASSEKDTAALSSELTDFATLPESRGSGTASKLLQVMRTAASDNGYKTLYTIARAINPGINIIFARAGYRYGGRLKNNTNIAGGIESMNVWYQNL